MTNNKTPILIPLQSISSFQFDSDILQYQMLLSNWELEPMDEFGKEYYKSPDNNLMLAVRKQKLESIFCYQTLYYQNINLIGLTIAELCQLFNTQPTGEVSEYDFEDDGYPQFVYQFDTIGLQVWEKQGKIVTIIASGQESYSNEPFYD